MECAETKRRRNAGHAETKRRVMCFTKNVEPSIEELYTFLCECITSVSAVAPGRIEAYTFNSSEYSTCKGVVVCHPSQYYTVHVGKYTMHRMHRQVGVSRLP